MAYVTTTANHTSSFSGRISAGFAALAASYRQHRQFRATVEEVGALSERELTDLGLCRADITRIARECAYSVA